MSPCSLLRSAVSQRLLRLLTGGTEAAGIRGMAVDGWMAIASCCACVFGLVVLWAIFGPWAPLTAGVLCGTLGPAGPMRAEGLRLCNPTNFRGIWPKLPACVC